MEKLDSFCKKLSANQVNFSVYTWEGKISACFYLTLGYSNSLTDNAPPSAETFSFSALYFTADLGKCGSMENG